MSVPDAIPPPPPPPPPAGTSSNWMPPPPPYSGADKASMGQRFTPESLAARLPWAFLAFLAQSIGLLLIFVAGLIAVTGAVIPANCYNSLTTCNTGTAVNLAYGIMVTRLLLVLGLFGLAAGAGLHLQFRPELRAGATPEETRVYLSRRRGEFVLLVLTLVFVFLIIWWSVASPTAIP
ncbi:MAG: hypothetical protein L3K10_02640 [Thermoplasmata archaeon]|nr:hypothetical protein [Thermoplasmata archaeon]